MIKYNGVQLCQQDAISIIPLERIQIDLAKTTEYLNQHDFKAENQEIMITAAKDNLEVSIYKNGRILISGTTSKETAENLGSEIYALQIDD